MLDVHLLSVNHIDGVEAGLQMASDAILVVVSQVYDCERQVTVHVRCVAPTRSFVIAISSSAQGTVRAEAFRRVAPAIEAHPPNMTKLTVANRRFRLFNAALPS